MKHIGKKLDARNRSLLALIVLLVAVIAIEFAAFDNTRTAAVSAVLSLDKSSLPVQTAYLSYQQMPALKAYSAVTSRPLFNSSRRPPEITITSAPVAMNRATKMLSLWKLTGVLITDDYKQVLMQNQKQRTTMQLEENMELAGWTLSSIHKRSATFELGEEKVTFALRTAKETDSDAH